MNTNTARYIIVTVPRSSANPGVWLAEWRALGPFSTLDEAEAARAALPSSPAWHTRVVELVAPGGLADRMRSFVDRVAAAERGDDPHGRKV